MKKLSYQSKVYIAENVLVVLMIGSAVALQIIRAKNAEDERTPLLLKIAEQLSDELVPWPFNKLASIVSEATDVE